MATRSAERSVADLCEWLLARQDEIEQAILARVEATTDPAEILDPAYAEGLRVAVTEGLAFGLEGIGRSPDNPPAVPVTLLAQARLAQRNGIGLEAVLRRYFGGYALLTDFLLEEAQRLGADRDGRLKDLLRAQAALFEHLLANVTEEYKREAERSRRSTEQRLAEHVQRLLEGESLDLSGLAYDFRQCHLAAIAQGSDAARVLRACAEGVGCRLLLVPRGEEIAWAWLGSRSPLDPAAFGAALSDEEVALALGEPAQGLPGWRRSHRQACAAFSVILRGGRSLARYAEVALEAAVLRDELFAASLRERYIAPLERDRDGGRAALETLRAYLAAGCNVSSAGAALGLSRRTVGNRLQAIERRIGKPLRTSIAEIEAALRLDALGASPVARAE